MILFQLFSIIFRIVETNNFLVTSSIHERFCRQIFACIFIIFLEKSSEMDDFLSFSRLTIVFWLQILKKSSYGLLNSTFEKSICYDQNEILTRKNEKKIIIFYIILQYNNNMKNKVTGIRISFFLFMIDKFILVIKKLTSQK